MAGSEQSLLALLDGLHGRGFSFSVLCNHPVMLEACRQRGVPAKLYDPAPFLLPADSPQVNPLPFLQTVNAVRRYARTQRAALIHANNLNPAQAAYVAARSLRLPIIAHVRTTRHFRASRYLCMARWCDGLVCVSHAVARSYWPDAPEGRLRVIYNGVDIARFERASGDAVRRRLAANGMPLIGTAAFLRPEKGVDDFVQLARLAAEAGRDCRFVIAGDGSEMQSLRTMVARNGLGERVRFLGCVRDMPSFMKALDVFVLTSYAEAMGRALVEAGAAGVPSVATNIDGIPEVVEDGSTGFLVPPGHCAEMWQRIANLLDSPPLKRRMGRAARKLVSGRFSLATYLDRMAEVYESTIDRWSRRGHGPRRGRTPLPLKGGM